MSTATVFWQSFTWFLTHVTPLAFLAAVTAVVAWGATREGLRKWHQHQDEQLTRSIAQRLREKETRLSVN